MRRLDERKKIVMKRLLSYVPFFGVLAMSIAVLYTFAITGSLGALALMIPCLIACGLTSELIKEE